MNTTCRHENLRVTNGLVTCDDCRKVQHGHKDNHQVAGLVAKNQTR